MITVISYHKRTVCLQFKRYKYVSIDAHYIPDVVGDFLKYFIDIIILSFRDFRLEHTILNISIVSATNKNVYCIQPSR